MAVVLSSSWLVYATPKIVQIVIRNEINLISEIQID